MIEKFEDLVIDYKDKNIKQRMTLLMFLPIVLVLLLLLILFFYGDLKGDWLIMIGLMSIGLTIAFSPQFISTTKIKINGLETEIIKKHFFGLICKKEIINSETISFSKISTETYDDNGKADGVQIRYWLVSSEYSNVNFLRLRNHSKEKKFKKIMSRVLGREIEDRNIFLSQKETL